MTFWQIVLVVVGLVIIANVVIPILTYMCAYLSERGKQNARRDSRFKLKIQKLTNLQKHGKEN
jgi:hypothetical protein